MNDVNTSVLKSRVIELVDEHAKLAQVVNDSLFSFGELGFHEVETAKFLTATLERHGFKVERGVAGMPTAWVATWGSGGPVIALRSDTEAMATPIAHKGVVAGAKVLAATVLDLLLQPELISETKRYFTDVQTKDKRYEPFIGPNDKPPLDLNETAMQKFRPLMRPFYYDADKYDTYLEQLNVAYPLLERPA